MPPDMGARPQENSPAPSLRCDVPLPDAERRRGLSATSRPAASGRRHPGPYFATITSDAFTTAQASSPTASASSSIASLVMDA